MSNGVKSWSYSALSLYEQCPFKYKCTKIDKLPEPTSPAMKRGRDVHDDCDKWLTGQITVMPESMRHFEASFIELKGLDPFTEQEWAFKRDWSDTHWRDWNGCWLRGKLDAGVTYADHEADVIDFKTGKPKGEYFDQERLFGLLTFLKHRDVNLVRTRLWFLDTGDETDPNTWTRDMVSSEKQYWEERVIPMFSDTIFAPRPNKFCNWCHFRKSNGGPCSHG